MQFDGPATVLVQSRGPRLNDVLSAQEVNEIAGTPRGLTYTPQQLEAEKVTVPHLTRSVETLDQDIKVISQSIAQIRSDGKVEVEESKVKVEEVEEVVRTKKV